MILTTFWAIALGISAVAFAALSAHFESQHEDSALRNSALTFMLSMYCYGGALYLLNDKVGAPLLQAVSNALPEPGTGAHTFTTWVVVVLLVLAGFFAAAGAGWKLRALLARRGNAKPLAVIE